MKFEEYDIAKTLVEKEGYPPGTRVVVVGFYKYLKEYEVQILDKSEDLSALLTYKSDELEKII